MRASEKQNDLISHRKWHDKRDGNQKKGVEAKNWLVECIAHITVLLCVIQYRWCLFWPSVTSCIFFATHNHTHRLHHPLARSLIHSFAYNFSVSRAPARVPTSSRLVDNQLESEKEDRVKIERKQRCPVTVTGSDLHSFLFLFLFGWCCCYCCYCHCCARCTISADFSERILPSLHFGQVVPVLCTKCLMCLFVYVWYSARLMCGVHLVYMNVRACDIVERFSPRTHTIKKKSHRNKITIVNW